MKSEIKSKKANGGVARAAVLTPEQRSEIAKKAAQGRWSNNKEDISLSAKKAICGSPEKMLKIGEVEIECYVLEDGTRVLSGRGMQQAIGLGGEAKPMGQN